MSILVSKLHNGVYIPAVALGTWQLSPEDGFGMCEVALKHGYRAVDDAWVYKNEEAVGKAVQRFDGKVTGPEKTPVRTSSTVVVSEQEFLSNFNVPHGPPTDARKVFVTSKIWVEHFTPEEIRAKTLEHLKNFGRSSCDLMLFHWPGKHAKFENGVTKTAEELNSDACRIRCWKVLEELYHEGKIRAIGVSNYLVQHLAPLLDDIKRRKAQGDSKATIPHANQVQAHPYHPVDPTLAKLCEENHIKLISYSILGGPNGSKSVLADPVLQNIANKHKKTVANVVVRWGMQMGYQVLPRSTKPDRVKANYDVMDFELTVDDMKQIASLARDACFGLDPATIA